MKIAFMGSDPIALPLLRYLHFERPCGIMLRAVFTQPDRRSGRGMHLHANAIKEWAMEHDLEVRQPSKCGSGDVAFLQAEDIQCVLVMAFGQILPRVVLEAVPMGFLNLHASLLPRLRGASPIPTAVALGLKESGVSLMRIIPKLDAGPVADTERVDILPAETADGLQDKLSNACVPLLRRTLPRLARGDLDFLEQEASAATYCRIINKTDCHLDFHQPAVELANRVRAFQPWPGTSFPWHETEIRVLEAVARKNRNHSLAPGTVIRSPEGGAAIACSTGILHLLRLQRPGGKPMPAVEFLRGFPVGEGSVVESREMQPLEGPVPFPYRKK